MNSVIQTIALLQRGYSLKIPDQGQGEICRVDKPPFWDEEQKCFASYRTLHIERTAADEVVRQLGNLSEFRWTNYSTTFALEGEYTDYVLSEAMELWANGFSEPVVTGGRSDRYKWAASLFAARPKNGQFDHVVIAFNTDSYDAAIGIAMRKCHQMYPVAEGWSNHSVSVITTLIAGTDGVKEVQQ